MSANMKWECTAVVYIDGETVVAEDDRGAVIAKGSAGADAADVIQAAIDAAHPAGQIKIRRGLYRLDKSVVLYNSGMLCGEGRGTVLVPPADDYALKVMTTDQTEIYRPFHGDPGPLYAAIVRDLTIDGESIGSRGKGIFMDTFWCSSFENLWIQNTDNALYLHHVRESDFTNIYLISNGSVELKEPSVVLIGENNNIHFRNLSVVYPNYIGMDLIGKTDEGIDVPRLVYLTQSFFHGRLAAPDELPREYDGKMEKDFGRTIAAPFDLIRLTDLGAHRHGCLADVVIRDSRITVAGPGAASVNCINSPLTVANCVMTATEGECVIRASKKSRVTVTGNTIHCGSETGSRYSLQVVDAEVIFKDNVLNGINLNIALAPASNSIIANNRFTLENGEPTIWVGDDGETGSANIEISGNIFTEKRAKSAVEVSPLAAENIRVHDNIFSGNYDGEACITGG